MSDIDLVTFDFAKKTLKGTSFVFLSVSGVGYTVIDVYTPHKGNKQVLSTRNLFKHKKKKREEHCFKIRNHFSNEINLVL